LAEIRVDERAPILQQYVRKVPGARPHMPVDRHASVGEFEGISAHFPVFRVDPASC